MSNNNPRPKPQSRLLRDAEVTSPNSQPCPYCDDGRVRAADWEQTRVGFRQNCMSCHKTVHEIRLLSLPVYTLINSDDETLNESI
jgi:hypothetical protein